MILYLVTDQEGVEFVEATVRGGVGLVQLREKRASFEELCEVGRYLLRILRPLGVPLIVNDRIDVAACIGADGVHLGQSDSSVQAARHRLSDQAIVGLSVNTLKEVNEAARLDVNYIAASPVFPSKTKTDCGPPCGIEGLKAFCQHSSHPVIAVGGIGPKNVAEVVSCGVRGIAVSSAILEAPYPEAAARRLLHV